jgi:hypothetical protein
LTKNAFIFNLKVLRVNLKRRKLEGLFEVESKESHELATVDIHVKLEVGGKQLEIVH